MVAQVVSMVDGETGRNAYAVWLGDARDPKNPRGLRGARLLNVYRTRREAYAAAKKAARNAL